MPDSKTDTLETMAYSDEETTDRINADDDETPKKDEEAGLEVILSQVGSFVTYVGKRFGDDRCLRMAAGLSYTSLLAIVPLMAIAFSVLAAFPVFEGVRDTVQDAIFANMLPQSADSIRANFDTFLENTTTLSAIGIVALALTAILLLATVEADINSIFRVTRARALAPRLLVFWALLTLGPLLLGASLSLSTYFFAVTQWVGLERETNDFLQTVLPTLMMILLLTVFYIIIPNRPVNITAGLIGGIFAGLAFTLLRKGFAWYVVTFPTYQNIYGALSVIPIFLVWMYLSWLVVLIGAVLAASISEWQSAAGKPMSNRLATNMRLIVAIQILAILYNAAKDGEGPVHRNRLLRSVGGGSEAVERILVLLQSANFVARSSTNRWVLARDTTSVTLYDLYRALGLGFSDQNLTLGDEHWRGRLNARISELKSLDQQALSASLREIFADPDQPHAAEVVRQNSR